MRGGQPLRLFSRSATGYNQENRVAEVTVVEQELTDGRMINGRSEIARGAGGSELRSLTLAGWTILPLQNRLVGEDKEVALEPKAMDVLVQLMLARGATLSSNELMDAVWPGVIVADDSVHRAISKLRRALADCSPLKDAVVTVPKRGYRLDWARLEEGSFAEAANGKAPTNAGVQHRLASAVGLTAAAILALLTLGAMVFRPASIDRSALRTTPFTGLPGQERAASFAPDGERAVFAWSGEDGSTWDLYVKGIDEWAPGRLTDQPGPEFNPAWSPDGAAIAFVHLVPGGECRIMTIDLASRQQRMLRGCTARGDVDLSWSPEADVLYFTDRVGTSGPIAVHALNLASGRERQLTYPPSDYLGDSFVRVSPDGATLAMARTRALGVTDVFTVSVNGGGEQQVTFDQLKVHGLAWSGDGEHLFFSSNRGGGFGLWQVGREGGNPQPVTIGGINADSVATSRDGRRLIFETESASSQLWSLPVGNGDTRAAEPLERASGWHWHPSRSPDGSSLAFVSDRSGTPEVWVAQADGNSPRKLTNFGGPYTNSPSWSPDGDKILFATPVAGNFEIYAVDVDTGILEQLTDHPATDRNPTWSQDGRSVYFASNRTGGWEVWRILLDQGSLEQVTRSGGFRAQENEDGAVVYVKRDQPGLFINDGKLGEEIELTDRLLPLDWSNWEVAGQGIYMVVRDEKAGASLAHFDTGTGKLDILQDLADFPHQSGLAIAPDRSTVMFARIDAIEVDLVLLEGF